MVVSIVGLRQRWKLNELGLAQLVPQPVNRDLCVSLTSVYSSEGDHFRAKNDRML